MLSCQSLAGFSSEYAIVSKNVNAGRELQPRQMKVIRQNKTEIKTYITQVHPPPSPSTPSTALVTRTPGAVGAAPPLPPAPHHTASEINTPRAGESLSCGLKIRIEGRVGLQDLVEDAQEAGVLAEGARRRRELRRRADRQARVGRLRGQVGQQVGGCRRGRVGEDFLWVGGSAFFFLFSLFIFFSMLH